MPVDQLRNALADALRKWGFEVKEIEETEVFKTPDLLVKNGSDEYLIEVKSKRDNPDRVAAERQRFTAGEIVERSDPLGVRNTIAGVIEEAAEQLEAFEPGTERIRLLWFQAVGDDAEVQERQFRATVFGTTNIIDIDDDGPMLPCYYFSESAFFRFKNSLDGAVVASGDQAQLLVNTYSLRVDRLRESALAERFGTAVLDPVRLEEAGEALVADCTVDRRDSGAVLSYLQTKYCREKLMNMEMGKTTVGMLVPQNDDPCKPGGQG